MATQSDERNRKSIRLKGYDYSEAGGYFITVVSRKRISVLGTIVDRECRLNECGRIAEECWSEIPAHFPNAELDAFVVMPNHLHGIIILHGVGARHAVPLRRCEKFGLPVAGSIPTIVRSFKSAVTKRVHETTNFPSSAVWQRNYYEHVIRDEVDLLRIREYIEMNPAMWAEDTENPDRS